MTLNRHLNKIPTSMNVIKDIVKHLGDSHPADVNLIRMV